MWILDINMALIFKTRLDQQQYVFPYRKYRLGHFS